MYAGKILVCLLSVAAELTPSTTSRCIRWLLSMLIPMEMFETYDVAKFFLISSQNLALFFFNDDFMKMLRVPGPMAT